ncbi:MAG: hypothetical protein L6Q97_23390 [Thermoanaerobaculia bacterium]|nr:hypothetical protein [Thermoanaerobaculia bacterium]
MKNLLFPAMLAFAVLALLPGCLTPGKLMLAGPELYSVNKPFLYILPLADARPDTSGSGNFDRWTARTLARQLKRKGYKTVQLKDRTAVDALEEDQLRGLRDTLVTADEKNLIAGFGPAEARWILLPVLQDYHLKMVLGCKATADAGCYLLDKQTGRTALWHKAVGTGSAGLLLCPIAGQTATESAFFIICNSFPKNPPVKK